MLALVAPPAAHDLLFIHASICSRLTQSSSEDYRVDPRCCLRFARELCAHAPQHQSMDGWTVIKQPEQKKSFKKIGQGFEQTQSDGQISFTVLLYRDGMRENYATARSLIP